MTRSQILFALLLALLHGCGQVGPLYPPPPDAPPPKTSEPGA